MNSKPLKDDIALLIAEARARNLKISSPGIWTDPDIIQLAQKLNLEIEITIILLLKKRWESFQAGYADADTGGYAQSINGFKRKFEIDTSDIIDLLESERLWSPTPDCSYETLNNLIQSAVLNKMYLVAINSPECKYFVSQQHVEKDVLEFADEKIKERIADARGCWIMRCSVHADLLMVLVNQQLINEHTNRQFMIVYGDIYLELEELAMSIDSLRRQIQLKTTDPALNRDELNQLVRDAEEKHRRALEKMKAHAIIVPYVPLTGGKIVNDEQVEMYRKKIKDALRRLWLLLHPEKIVWKKGYKQLSQKQRNRLKEIWNEAMDVRPEELAFEPGQIGYTQRSLERILQAEREVRAILESFPGIDLDAKYQVQGNTAEERLLWYETECCQLDEDIEQTRAQIKALIDNPLVCERRAAINVSEKQQESIREQMRKKVEHYRSLLQSLQDQLEQLFKNTRTK